MFCYQCEQTARSEACTVRGVCGKQPDVAAIQDALVYALKGLALVVNEAAPHGLVPSDTYPFLAEGLFSTLTNVNFDPDALVVWVQESAVRRDALKAALAKKGRAVDFTESPVSFMPAATAELVARQGEEHGINVESSSDVNLRSLQHTVLYGLKGVAAYAFHAAVLGYRDPAIDDYLVEALVDLARYDQGDLQAWIAKVLR